MNEFTDSPTDRPQDVVVVSWIAVVYLVYSEVAYLAYGPSVRTVVTLSLGDSLFPAAAVRGTYCLAIIFTFPLMLFPASQEIENSLCCCQQKDTEKDTGHSGRGDRGNGGNRDGGGGGSGRGSGASGCDGKRVSGDLLRVLLLTCCWAMAVVGRSSLDHIVALLGSLCSAPLALIVPPLMHRSVMVQREVSYFGSLFVSNTFVQSVGRPTGRLVTQ